jgi:SAM-dependent methyltransferase
MPPMPGALEARATRAAAAVLTPETRRRLRRLRAIPQLGPPVRFGSLRRLTPISRWYGFDRGQPVDRYYIDRFLERHAGSPDYTAGAIAGRVLEIGGREYADRFGHAVRAVDVLHADASNTEATIVGDLTDAGALPPETFDCIICTQTLHVIYDFRAALRTMYGALRPGGTLLATVPGITGSCRPDRDAWGDWWRFTAASARRTAEEVFPADHVHVETFGNVLSATAFLYGLAAIELRPHELDVHDPNYEVLVALRLRKPAGPGRAH